MAVSNEIEAVKVSLRINTVLFDDEISALIDSAKSDMAGAGVDVNDKTQLHLLCRQSNSIAALISRLPPTANGHGITKNCVMQWRREEHKHNECGYSC